MADTTIPPADPDHGATTERVAPWRARHHGSHPPSDDGERAVVRGWRGRAARLAALPSRRGILGIAKSRQADAICGAAFRSRSLATLFLGTKNMDVAQNVFHTGFMRINNLIRVCAQRLRESRSEGNIKILSFGCSVGDEVGTLLCYFPKSEIYACDIDKRLVAICRRSFISGGPAEVFFSNEKNIAAHGPYDLIVASAVLCRNPAPKNYAEEFPFSRFDTILSFFDAHLRGGGIIAIPNTGYLFSESSICKDYRAIRSDVGVGASFVNVYRKDGSIFLRQEPSYGSHILSRHGSWSFDDDESVFDFMFEKTPGAKQPIFLQLSPVPADLKIESTYIRRNIDYSPKTIHENSVIMEQKIDILSDPSGKICGYATSIGWSSFVREGMYHRSTPPWFVPVHVR
ncbi:class I SAM-dependent methyltransferase [Methylobacterium sp. Leaf118]|uniref:class I SAM-dependent methyltransferase n=1 Tax=Methylobacterium sp. Leaf118 TaxID=2876562 RepID=UPI001E3C2C7F|nr:class I SAM-dependent methyltransferase [Methylobacterium sp. Leaf118]